MRTPTEALKEIRDRLTYFCLRTDGKYDPPWATELVGIIDEAVTDSHAIGNAAAMREALETIHDKVNGLDEECGVAPVEVRDLARAALSAPARNCDRYKDAPSAYADFIVPWKLDGHLDDAPTLQDFANWLLAPAAERKGEGDGR